MTGPDHHAEMEAHYAAGMERQERQFAFDDALSEAKARLAEEIEREGWPPSADVLIAWGVGAGVRAASKPLLREIGDAREELSRLKSELARQTAVSDCQTHFGGGGLKGILGSHADIDLVQQWHHGFVRADYLAERLKLHINEAQRLALLVRELGGDPEPSTSTPNDEAGMKPASQPSTPNDE